MKEKIQVFPMSENLNRNLSSNVNDLNDFLIVDMNQNLIESSSTSAKNIIKNKQIACLSSNKSNGCLSEPTDDTVKNELAENLEEFYLKAPYNKLKLNKIVESAIHWSLVNGFVIVPKERSETDLMVCTYLPFTLCPTPIKKSYFEQVLHLQPHINSLVYRIANSHQTMKTALEK